MLKPTADYKNKVALLYGIPEWLKEFSKKKIERLEVFNYLINELISMQNSGMLVFIFSESKEWSKSFISKFFNDKILQNREWFKIIKLNPITQQNIEKKIDSIRRQYGINLGQEMIDQIITSSNKDLRSILQNLQLYWSSNIGIEDIGHSYSNKRAKDKNKSNINYMTQNNYSNVSLFENESVEKSKKFGTEMWSKDYGLSIFHAIGKFLYNKRKVSSKQEPVRLTYLEMKKKPRPKFYENHLNILNKVQTESSTFSLFLYENMLDHFGDISDWAKVLEAYSLNDSLLNRNSYSYWNMHYVEEIQQLTTHIECLAITEYNLHGGDLPKDNKLKMFAKPMFFEYKRKLNESKLLLNDSLKIDQWLRKEIVSEDMLIGSSFRSLTDYLPYLFQIEAFRKMDFLQPLAKLVNFKAKTINLGINKFWEDELCNDDQDKEFLNDLSIKNLQKQKFIKKKNAKDGFAQKANKPKAMFVEEKISDSSNESIDIAEEDLKDIISEWNNKNSAEEVEDINEADIQEWLNDIDEDTLRDLDGLLNSD